MLNLISIIFPFFKSSASEKTVSYKGVFESWEQATKNSAGYDSECILKKSNDTLDKIITGAKKCEKDTISFDEYQYSLPLLLGLNYITKAAKDNLYVLDFGGSFASSYFRNFDVLENLNVKWTVVEQKKIVEIALAKLKHINNLSFITSSELDLEKKKKSYNVVLFGSSLQFMQSPSDTIKNVIHQGVESIIFEQTPVVNSGERKLTVQEVKEPIYDASYPAWHFNEKELFDWIGPTFLLRHKLINPHVTNHCDGFESKLFDYVFTKKS